MIKPAFSSMPHWKQLLAESVTTLDQLADRFDVSLLEPVVRNFPLRINPHYFSLIRYPGDPMWRQAVPDPAELADVTGSEDPLGEEPSSPVPGLIRRYPDRAVLLVSDRCALHCRFCMRKRRVGVQSNQTNVTAGIDFIRHTPDIHEVILSGGDPLMIDDESLALMLEAIRSIGHVRLVRIHSRMPCSLPQRITDDLVRLLSAFQPIYLNTHFNHPDEICPQSVEACRRLSDAGIVLGAQTVLLRGVNDDPAIMHRLMEDLLAIRVRPYYLHQLDCVRGTGHFYVSPVKGKAIMRQLRGRMSGMGVPHHMVDLPGGGGKVPLTPEYVVRKEAHRWVVENFEGRRFSYPLGPDQGAPTSA